MTTASPLGLNRRLFAFCAALEIVKVYEPADRLLETTPAESRRSHPVDAETSNETSTVPAGTLSSFTACEVPEPVPSCVSAVQSTETDQPVDKVQPLLTNSG